MNVKLLSLILIQPLCTNPSQFLDHAPVQIEHYSVLDLHTNLLPLSKGLRDAGLPLNKRIQVRDPNYGLFELEKDMYGDKFFYATPQQMVNALDEVMLLSEWDDAVMKFLKLLSPEIKVIPWWH